MAEQQHRAAASGGACLLPFPQKFDAARSFVEGLPHGSDLLSDDAWLALGALHSQATKGPCQEPKRWGLISSSSGSSPAAEAAWRELGAMPAAEAMRLYVRVLDEEAPGWWRAVGAVGSSGVAVGREEEGTCGGGKERGDGDRRGEEEEEDGDIGRWVSLSTAPEASSAATASTSSGSPCPRYEHAAALLGRALFVVGGSRAGGRMLADSWALDLETLRWSNLFQSPPPSSSSLGGGGSLPPRAGLCLLPWKKPGSGRPARLLAIGGHAPKSGRGGPAPTEMEVWRLERTPSGGGGLLLSWRWALVPTSVAEGARPPPPRGGHSVTVIPGTSRAFVFGGEVDGDGRGPTNDLFELCLDSMTWRGPLRVRGGDPSSSSRGRHAAAAPSPRSGHVAAAVGRFLVVFGGADGERVYGDVAVLDVDSLEWLRPEVEVREEEDAESSSDGGGEAVAADKDGEKRRRQKNKNRRKLVVSPRAGASAAVIGRTVFVAGGGDGSDSSSSSSSRLEATTLALDCSRLPRGPLLWRRAATDDDDETSASASPASSEGLALVALPQVRALLAFGGNAGRLHANLAVLRPKAGVIVDADDDDEGEEEGEEGEEGERAANGGAGASSDDNDEIPSAAPRPSAAAAAAATAAAAAASPSPSPSELALMRRQLASAQAAAADAAMRAGEAEREVERLGIENGRLRRRLAAVLNGDSSSEEGGGGGRDEGEACEGGKDDTSSRRPRAPRVWAYISGA